jgi:hypothetical protein
MGQKINPIGFRLGINRTCTEEQETFKNRMI